MAPSRLRIRAFLDEWFTVVVAVCLVLALAGGWMTYTTHVDPGTTTEQRQVSAWETTGQFTHSATVQRNTSVFPAGTTLTNRSVYFTEVSPVLDGSYRFTYTASRNAALDQTVALDLVVRGVDQRDGRETPQVLWQTNQSLGETTVQSGAPGETIRVPFSLNVSAVANRTEQIDAELGSPPGDTEVFVRATVDLHGTVNGREVRERETHRLPIALGGSTYRPQTPEPATEEHTTNSTATVPERYGPTRRLGGPALGFVALVPLAGLVAGRWRGRLALTEREREHLAFTDDRHDFDEWISTIELPAEALARPRAEADSLGALVDFAIDTDNGVVEDPSENAYFVLHGDYLYTYCPPGVP